MATKENSTLDLNFRPATYFWAKRRGIYLTSDIPGVERRRLYERALALGNDPKTLPPELSGQALSAEDRAQLGSIHPTFMGGEYLPQAKAGEVEIARIAINSTTQDVTCVYARQVGKRIHYRVVDEYEGDTLDGPNTRTSAKPLTLKELVDFFLRGWDLIGCLEMNSESWSAPSVEAHRFITDASSSFYAQFEDAVRVRVEEWLSTLPDDEDEDGEED